MLGFTRYIEPIIRSVLQNIAGMEVEKLPKPATLLRMLTELKCLSYQQIADELQDCKNITLHLRRWYIQIWTALWVFPDLY